MRRKRRSKNTTIFRHRFSRTRSYCLVEDYDIDRIRAVSNLLSLVPVRPERHEQAILKAVQYQEEHEMTNFDSLHAGVIDTWGAPVLGSERAYDELDIERYLLEPDAGHSE